MYLTTFTSIGLVIVIICAFICSEKVKVFSLILGILFPILVSLIPTSNTIDIIANCLIQTLVCWFGYILGRIIHANWIKK